MADDAPKRILVVEDEVHLAEGLCANLQAEGYAPSLVADGLQAVAELRARPVDLVVLDVMLPGQNGLDVCRRLRTYDWRTPVLFLSAKGSAEERVEGLNAGADDYLAKPFHLEEFLGRIKALLRRANTRQAAPSAAREPWLQLGACRVDFARHQLTTATGGVVDVPARELAILRLLWGRAGEVVSRDEILDQVWGHDVYPSSRTVDNFIVRLRRWLEPDPAEPRYLHTIRGVGYRLLCSEERHDQRP